MTSIFSLENISKGSKDDYDILSIDIDNNAQNGIITVKLNNGMVLSYEFDIGESLSKIDEIIKGELIILNRFKKLKKIINEI